MAEATGQAERERREGGLHGRLRFAGLEAEESAFVRDNRSRLLPHVKTALRDLFQRLQTYPDAARNFQSEGQIDRLYDLMQSHWDVLTDARFDSLYAERVKVLTDSESRIGLDPRWHIAGQAVVLEHLLVGMIEHHWPKSLIGRSDRNRETLVKLVRALLRTAMVDLEISNSLRFNELRLGHQQALGSAVAGQKSQTRAVLGHIAERIRAKDFASPLAIEFAEDHADVASDLVAALAEIRTALAGSREGTEKLSALSGRLALSAEALADGNMRSADALASVDSEIRATASRAGAAMDKAAAAETATEKARAAAMASSNVVSEAIVAMADIEKSAEKIGQIIGVIDEIAFQTNLLALNAGIEAARAGESGRGFAVVAQEVRALAQRSADAAREIKDLVTGTKAQVDSGVAMVNRTQSAIGDIAEQVTGINEAVSGLARETREIASGIAVISGSSDAIGTDLRRSADAARQTLQDSSDLNTVILELGATIRKFHLDHYPAAAVPAPAAKVESAVSALAAPAAADAAISSAFDRDLNLARFPTALGRLAS